MSMQIFNLDFYLFYLRGFFSYQELIIFFFKTHHANIVYLYIKKEKNNLFEML